MVRVLHVLPPDNTGYQASLVRPEHRALGDTVDAVWQRLLRRPDRFTHVDPAVFLNPGITSGEYLARYGSPAPEQPSLGAGHGGGDDQQRTAGSFATLVELADCEDETELTEVLTDRLDPHGVTGQVVLVEHDGDGWTLRVPGHWATLIEFPTTLAWVEEAAEDLLRETLQARDEAATQKAEEAVIEDRAVLEAASSRLANALQRRHPERLRLIRAFPAGGQADCLWLLPAMAAPATSG